MSNMSRTDLTDPQLADDGRRGARAADMLRDRIDGLRRKLVDASDRIDLPGQIRRHPWSAVGIAFALGALSSGIAGAASRPVPTRTRGRRAVSALAALGLHVVRELAIAQLGRSARRWWIEHGGDALDDARGPSTQRSADLAPFLEH